MHKMNNILLFIFITKIVGYCCLLSPLRPFAINRLSSTVLSTQEDLQTVELQQLSRIADDLHRYRMKGTILSDDAVEYLERCKADTVNEGVTFPGFRPGRFPPHALAELRSDTLRNCVLYCLNEVCEMNNLEVNESQVL